MSSDGRFLVEEFLEALTSQLDRTQDALRLKAVNRPLTYAVRDFSLELRVFVEMDGQGHVIFRSAGANEEGASIVSIGFTTVTRPMIEENTMTLEEARGPSLEELGLDQEEQRRMEKIGVRNAAQLKRLTNSSDESTLARFSNVPVNRLRSALQASRPTVHRVEIDQAEEPPRPGAEQTPRPISPPVRRARRLPDIASPDRPIPGPAPRERQAAGGRQIMPPQQPGRLRIDGERLRGLRGTPQASLDGQPVDVVSSDDSHLIVDLGDMAPVGTLGIDFGDDAIEIELGADGYEAYTNDDPWSPS